MEKTHDSVESMVRAYSQAAVELAREFKAALDYTDNSVMEVEVILAQFAQDLARAKPLPMKWTRCASYGAATWERSYAAASVVNGESKTIRKTVCTLTLNVGGNKLFPSMKIHRRLTEGDNDNVWTFYKMVKANWRLCPAERCSDNKSASIRFDSAVKPSQWPSVKSASSAVSLLQF